MAFAHKAASDFVSRSTRTAAHPHLLQTAFHFFRPTFPLKKAVLNIRVANSVKATTTLHVDLQQEGRTSLAGYITWVGLGHYVYTANISANLIPSMADLSRTGQFTVETGWQLTPPPIPTTIRSLKDDRDPDWVSYQYPYSPESLGRAQSYVKFYVPIKGQGANYVDQWITPGWRDDDAPNGPVWTNELVQFAVDASLPVLNNLLKTSGKPGFHEAVVRTGLLQRKARLEGRDDRIIGEELKDAALLPWIISTTTIATEVKRLLPEEGVKWLFLRATTRMLLNDRMDYDVVLLDEHGLLIATSQHVLQVIASGTKKARLSNI